jgi:hypothetical protein
MLHRLMAYNITTLKDLVTEYANKRYNVLFLDVFQIYNSVPREWITMLRRTGRSHNPICNQIYTDVNKWTDINKVTLKDLKKILSTEKEIKDINEYITLKHGLENGNVIIGNPFVKLFKDIKDVKIRNVQFKMLHNIYPTRKHLYNWKLSECPNCTKCNVIETLKHAIWECDIAQNAISNFKTAVTLIYPEIESFNISYVTILLGVNNVQNNWVGTVDRKTKNVINTCLVLLKQKLVLQRENKTYITLDEIKSLIAERINIEKYNSKLRCKR